MEILRDELTKPWHDHALELATAALLALTTVASAWCAYQSARWSAIQTFRLTSANLASREATENIILANETRMMDWAMFMQLVDALEDGNQPLVEFYRARFRPEAKGVVEAWLAADPFRNREAPVNPFVMPGYGVGQMEEARRLQRVAAEHHKAAERANRQADDYVLLTVLFASVLFFGGIVSHFQMLRIRVVVFVIGAVVFVGAVTRLVTYPVVW